MPEISKDIQYGIGLALKLTCMPDQGYWRGKYHCTVDLLFDWFGLVCFANKNKNYLLSYSWSQTSQTGGLQYSDTSPFSIPWLGPLNLSTSDDAKKVLWRQFPAVFPQEMSKFLSGMHVSVIRDTLLSEPWLHAKIFRDICSLFFTTIGWTTYYIWYAFFTLQSVKFTSQWGSFSH